MRDLNYERCPNETAPLVYEGVPVEINGVKMVCGVCPVFGCNYKIYVPLTEAEKITERRRGLITKS